MRYLDLFSGIGGFALGIQQAYEDNNSREQKPIRERAIRSDLQRQGNQPSIDSHREESQKKQRHRVREWLCIGYSEIDKYAIQVYEKHFDHKNYGDITAINEKELPDFELLVGGFPCQAFSIAGKRGGFDDTRGTLFFEIARIVREKQPRLLLLENVKGLLSHDKGHTFSTIISTLDELGYDLQWQVLNSKNHGVPQNRERVFIVGHLRGTPRPQVFPLGGSNSSNSEIKVVADMTGEKWDKFNESSRRVYGDDGISPTVPTGAGGGHTPKVLRQPLKFLKRNQKNVDGRHSFTVDSMNTGGVRVDNQIRRLTPLECERLQGFPDNWTEDLSDTQRYKTLGNAVTVNVVRDIVNEII